MSRSKHQSTKEELGLALPQCPKCHRNTIIPILAAYDGEYDTYFVEEVQCQRPSCPYKAPKHIYERRAQRNDERSRTRYPKRSRRS